jgi:hypothetical protein
MNEPDRRRPYLDVVFDGPPGPEVDRPSNSGAFVEVESPAGVSVQVGTWIPPTAEDPYWRLRLTVQDFEAPEVR